MAQCPSCQQQVEIDSQFYGGLFTCPKCQSVYFIGFDGSPEQNVPDEPSPNNPSFSLPPTENTSDQQDFAQLTEPPAQPYSTGYDQNQFPQPQEMQPYNAGQEEQPVESTPYHDNFAPLDSTPAAPVNPLQEIVNFGNNEVVDTAFSYKLLIRGLDITQNVDELRDILTDSKLGLNFNKLKSQIRNGELIIDKIDGAKAAIIAQRLRTLPVEMVWEQKLYE